MWDVSRADINFTEYCPYEPGHPLVHCYRPSLQLLLAQAASEVIQLNFRMAQDILPVVQSVLGEQGRATAYGNQLIVNASDDKIAELRAVLEQIDTQTSPLAD